MNPKPEGEDIIALRVHPKIRQRGDPLPIFPYAGRAQFPSNFLSYNRPCFTHFHLELDRSVNWKMTMRKSVARISLVFLVWLFRNIVLSVSRFNSRASQKCIYIIPIFAKSMCKFTNIITSISAFPPYSVYYHSQMHVRLPNHRLDCIPRDYGQQ